MTSDHCFVNGCPHSPIVNRFYCAVHFKAKVNPTGDNPEPPLVSVLNDSRINPEIKPDPVNPTHYKGDAVMIFIEQFDLGFCDGNAVKYIARHQTKGTPLEDLRKARWYLDRAISNLETLPNDKT